jgi:hypothetical protein
VTTENIVECFHEYDENGDGTINRAELRRIFEALDRDGNFTEADLDTIIDEVDTSKDGVIDYVEFTAWLRGESRSQALDIKQKFQIHASTYETPAQILTRLEEELRQAEEALIFSMPVEVDLKESDLWMFTGKSETETVKSLCASKEASVVKQISSVMEAHHKGVRIGYRVIAVGDQKVSFNENVMQLLLRGCRGGGVRVGFVSPEQVKAYEEAEKALLKLRTDVEEARAALDLREGLHGMLANIRAS